MSSNLIYINELLLPFSQKINKLLQILSSWYYAHSKLLAMSKTLKFETKYYLVSMSLAIYTFDRSIRLVSMSLTIYTDLMDLLDL